MTLRLQTESPADQDMFRGSSHEKVAENVAQIIRNLMSILLVWKVSWVQVSQQY